MFGFSAKSNEILEKFIVDFIDPPGTVSRISSLWIYGSINVYRVGDVVIFKTDGMMEFLGKYLLTTSFFIYVVSLILGYSMVSNVVIPFMFLALLLFFAPYHAFQTVLKLKKYGYKDKIRILDYLSIKTRYDYATGNS